MAMEDPTQEILRDVTERARALYRVVDPLAERLLCRLPAQGVAGPAQPLVLVLGSHSSGKSSFINHLLGRAVQQTGVAPTDDAFTIIAPGPVDEDRDGAAAVGTPGLGLGELARFGPVLQAHLRLKLRAGCPVLDRMWLVDTPGMIDAAEGASAGRGYDFLGVLRWFAERADVVLLLFDPHKPGTTGETLSALTRSLAQAERKLLIVLNKADECRSVQDFARAYGALCWNLAKVVPRKDLPRIYTCYVPGPGRPAEASEVPLGDFDAGREEILAEVRRAPERRVDNVLTRLHDDARDVLVYAQVTAGVRAELSSVRWRWRGRALLAAAAGGVLSAALSLGESALGWGLAPLWTGAPAALALLGSVVLLLLGGRATKRRAEALLRDLTPVFERLHRPALAVAESSDLRALWQRLHGPLRTALTTLGVERLPRVPGRQLRALEQVLGQDVPALRARVCVRNHPAPGSP